MLSGVAAVAVAQAAEAGGGAAHESFVWVGLIPGLRELPVHVSVGFVVIGVLLVSGALVRRALRDPEAALVPPARLTVANVFEIGIEGLLGLMETVLGHHAQRFLPLIGTLALFILLSNLSGLIPGFLPPTDKINTTAACAIVVFVTTHYVGFKEHGLAYLKHFTGPFWYMAPLIFPVEMIGHLVRPVSLSLRLFANIMADHLVVGIFLGLIPLIVPIPMMILGLFVAFVQTLVFILLSMMYIAGALEEGEH
ncbi:MAG: F0F1 ATP synthase subunit A [Deltaproteobacteria bacterium]|nr:F0F1 ATP synthase subunit A [Deltaproteobacteria bacterium]